MHLFEGDLFHGKASSVFLSLEGCQGCLNNSVFLTLGIHLFALFMGRGARALFLPTYEPST